MCGCTVLLHPLEHIMIMSGLENQPKKQFVDLNQKLISFKLQVFKHETQHCSKLEYLFFKHQVDVYSYLNSSGCNLLPFIEK